MAYLDEHAFDLGEQNGFRMVINSMDARGIEYDTLQIFKEQAVWMFVELFAGQLLQRNGHPDWVWPVHSGTYVKAFRPGAMPGRTYYPRTERG